MELLITNIVGAISNIVVFSLLPLIWWLIFHRKKENFFKWVGLYKPQLKSKWWMVVLFAVVYYFLYTFDITKFVSEESMAVVESSESVAANAFTGLGMAAVLPAMIQNFVANGLSEELLYRGFIGKRLCAKFGSLPGIIIQGALFGLMHNGLYVLAGVPVGMDFHVMMFLFTGGAGLLLAWLDEKIFNGSIVPSILLHGLGNFIGSLRVAFRWW